MPDNQKNSSVGTVAIAALIGGVTGAFVSLMFTPKSGKELRQDIQNKAEDIIEKVEDTTFQNVEALKKRSTELVEKGKKLKADFQILIQDMRQKRPGYIDLTHSTPVETSLQPETETRTPEFVAAEIKDHKVIL